MANRDTVKSNIITKNVPTITNAKLTDMLNNELADNVKFREDVGASQSSAVSEITVNFTGKDRVDLNRTGGALNISVSGMGDGEEKSLLITKTAGQAITFSGITDVTSIIDNVTSQSIVLYTIVRKGSNYFARAWVDTVKQATDTVIGAAAIATQAENNALSNATKMCVPGRLPLSSATQKGLVELATQAEAEAKEDDSRALTPLQAYNLFKSIAPVSVMTLTDKAGNVTVQDYYAAKYGPIIYGFFIARCSSTGNFQVGRLSGYIPKSGGNWSFQGSAETPTESEVGAMGYLTQGSNLFINVGRTNTDFIFNFAIVVNDESIDG